MSLQESIPMTLVEIGDVVHEYKITEKLDEGGFGQVFKVVSLREPQLGSMAMKVESNQIEGGSAIKLENEVMTLLNALNSYHFPVKYHAGRKKHYSYIIMELLGHNLKNLRLQSPEEISSPSTYSRIGVQCLFAIKQLHEIGFVHRDIKPGNFVVGCSSPKDPLRSHVIFLLDFGLSRTYATKDTLGLFKIRLARPTVEFRGTMRYCSPNAHEQKELGRVDDIWSLMYMMVEMLKHLPWEKAMEPCVVQQMKTMPDSWLLEGGAEHFLPIFNHLRSSNYYSRPNYSMIYDVFSNIYRVHNVNLEDPYDWETANLESYIRWKTARASAATRYPWEEPADFFRSDAYPSDLSTVLEGSTPSNDPDRAEKIIKEDLKLRSAAVNKPQPDVLPKEDKQKAGKKVDAKNSKEVEVAAESDKNSKPTFSLAADSHQPKNELSGAELRWVTGELQDSEEKRGMTPTKEISKSLMKCKLKESCQKSCFSQARNSTRSQVPSPGAGQKKEMQEAKKKKTKTSKDTVKNRLSKSRPNGIPKAQEKVKPAISSLTRYEEKKGLHEVQNDGKKKSKHKEGMKHTGVSKEVGKKKKEGKVPNHGSNTHKAPEKEVQPKK